MIWRKTVVPLELFDGIAEGPGTNADLISSGSDPPGNLEVLIPLISHVCYSNNNRRYDYNLRSNDKPCCANDCDRHSCGLSHASCIFCKIVTRRTGRAAGVETM